MPAAPVAAVPAAPVAAVAAAPAPAIPPAAAAAVAVGSDATLAGYYAAMLAVPAFAEVSAIVTANQRITLTDSGVGGPTDYTHATHRIRIPANANAAFRRDDMVFELHNAKKRGNLTRAHGMAPPALGPSPSLEDRAVHKTRTALSALAVEWEEWVNVAEMHERCVLINAANAADIANGGPGGFDVSDQFGGQYPVNGTGWYVFKNYLNAMRAAGHTAGYDANAGAANWIGMTILQTVSGTKANSLKITVKQLSDWGSGNRTSHVKQANPFIITGAAAIKKLAGY